MPTGNIQCTHKFINQRCLLFHLLRELKELAKKVSPDLNKNLINETYPQKHMPSFWIPAFSLFRALRQEQRGCSQTFLRKREEKKQISCTLLFLFFSFEQRLTYKCWREDFCLRRMLNDFRHNCPHFPSHLLSLPPYPPLAFFLLFRHTNTHTNKAAEAARRELIQADRTQWHPWHFGGKACRF